MCPEEADRNPLDDDLGKCFGDWMHFILSIVFQSNPQFPETFLALQLCLPSTLQGKHAKNIELDICNFFYTQKYLKSDAKISLQALKLL